jgi:O-antigen/teichoic acid export membrane protein
MRRVIPLAARYGALFIQFAVVALVTRALSKSEAGVYLSLNGVVQASFFLAGFGAPDGLVRTVSTLRGLGQVNEAGRVLFRGTVFSLGTLVPTACVIGLAVSAISRDLTLGFLFMLWWASYGVMFVVAQALVAIGRAELGTFAFYTLINVGLAVVLVPAAVFGAVVSARSAIIFTVLGAFVSLAVFSPVFIRAARRAGATPGSAPAMAETRRVGVAIAANRILQAACIWSPVWIVSILHGAAWGAVVAVGSRLVGVVGAALAAINFSIRPQLVDLAVGGSDDELRKLLRRVSSFALGVVVVALAGDLVVGRVVIKMLFGAGYGQVTWVLALLLVGAAGDAIAGAAAEVVKMLGSAGWLVGVQTVVFSLGAGLQFAAGHWIGVWAQLSVFVVSTAVFNMVVRGGAMSVLKEQRAERVLA